jgi:hypothetical protein
MRSHGPEDIFSQPTPLITGSVAEGWEQAVSEWILNLSNQAIEVKPELAAAYFLRGWAKFLVKQNHRPFGMALFNRLQPLTPARWLMRWEI